MAEERNERYISGYTAENFAAVMAEGVRAGTVTARRYGSGPPTTATLGAVGDLYTDILPNGKLYRCTAASGGVYTWVEVGGGVLIDDTLSVQGAAADAKAVGDALHDIVSDAWDGDTTYSAGDMCIYKNVLYKCLIGNRGQRPDISPTYWTATTLASISSFRYISSVTNSSSIALPNNWQEVIILFSLDATHGNATGIAHYIRGMQNHSLGKNGGQARQMVFSLFVSAAEYYLCYGTLSDDETSWHIEVAKKNGADIPASSYKLSVYAK